MRWLVAFAMIASAADVRGQDPASELAAAVEDVAKLPAQERLVTRYVSDYNGAGNDVVVAYWANAISGSRVLYTPVKVRSGLWRINLSYLSGPTGLPSVLSAWEKMAAQDPYWHLRTAVLKASTGKIEEISTDGGWVGLGAAGGLRSHTNSSGAILRLDFVVAKGLSTLGGGVYYDFLGLPAKEAGFLGSIGVDGKLINSLSANTAANLLRSNVTFKSRRILHFPGPLGSLYQTKDINAEAPDKDPIRNPVDFKTQRYNFDASEFFFVMPNRYWGTALYDARGNLQQSVPDAIAHDLLGQSDGRVQPLISCLRCHTAGGSDGLQSFSDNQFPLLTTQAKAFSQFPEVAQKLGELYQPWRIEKAIDRDREDYNEAVVASTGVSADRAATLVVGTYQSYQDEQVDIQKAAKELGCTEEVFVSSTSPTTDPALSALRAGTPINREAWNSSFQEAALLVAGKK